MCFTSYQFKVLHISLKFFLFPICIFFVLRSIANSAYEMKKNWDELVAAKQAERDRQKLAKLDESDTSTTISGYTTPHLVPNVIVTSSTLVSIDLTTYKINRFSINCKCYTKYFLVLASQHCFETTIYTQNQKIENFSKY